MRFVAGGRNNRSQKSLNSGTTTHELIMRKQKGFSFIEVMTAMFVVTAGLLVVIKLFSSGFINSGMDRDRIIAAGLAQEGLEIVKNIRDNSLAIPGSADGFGVFPAGGKTFCFLGYNSSPLSLRDSGGSQNCFNKVDSSPEGEFSLDQSGGSYVTATTTKKFARVLYADLSGSAPNQIVDVTSIVWWGEGSGVSPAGLFSDAAHTAPVLSNCKITPPVAAIPPNTPAQPARGCVYATMRLEAWKS
jgi:prepilin-type N-terminal cleavage/methylation domain-containing protein